MIGTTDVVDIVLRTAVVYAAVLLGLRLGGRRELGQLTPFDLVVVLLVANAVQNAMVGPDTTLLGGVVSAATLLVANAGVARLRLSSPRLQHLIEGVPVVLAQHGAFIEKNLKREGLTEEEVLAAIREHGEFADVSLIELAVLETDGSLSVVPKTSTVHRSPRRLRHRKQP